MSGNAVFNITSILSALSILIPFVIGIIKIKALDTSLKIVFLYVTFSLCIEVVSFIYTLNNAPDYAIRNAFTIVEFFVFIALYFWNFENKIEKTLVFVALLAFLTLSIISFAFRSEFNTQSGSITSVEAIALTVFSCYGLLKSVLNEQFYFNLNKHYFTWINYAVLIYFGINLFLFLLDSKIDKLAITNFYIFYGLHLLVNIVYNALLGVSLWKAHQK